MPADSFSTVVIASKKIGNALTRNFCKRRLRELSRIYIQPNSKPITLILLCRVNTALANFSQLIDDSSKFTRTFNK